MSLKINWYLKAVFKSFFPVTRNISFIIGVLVITALIFPSMLSAASTSSSSSKGETEIVILHMNDLHAKIDNLAKIAWLIEEEKKKTENVIVLNAGDNFSGNPIVDQYNPKGDPMVKLLHKIKPDVMTLGNHEFDYGQEVLGDVLRKASFPIICANMDAKESLIPQLDPYIILKTKSGLKVAVLGLLEVSKHNNIPSAHPLKIKGIKFTDGIETAKLYRNLKKKCDIFIALSHLGIEDDERLAQEMGELDLIVGGHSHTAIKNPVIVNNVMITQAGGNGWYLGRIKLTVKDGKIISRESSLISLRSIHNEVPEIKSMIDKYNKAPHLDKLVATIPMVLEGKDQLGNLVTDAIRRMHNLDIAIQNQGGIRSFRLGKEIRLRNIYKALPFGNDIVMFKMTGKEIESFIQYDYNRGKRLDAKVSGITYTIIKDKNDEYKGVEIKELDGSPLDPSKIYKVGMNNYIATSYKFEHTDPGQSLQTTISQTLIDYLHKKENIFDNILKMRTVEIQEK